MTPSSRAPGEPSPGDNEVLLSPPQLPRRRGRPSRRTVLSVEEIVAAAIDVLDAGGVASLTMRRVAGRLGTSPGALYVHISGRDELLDLVFDELVGQVPLVEPDPARWREQLLEIMESFYAVLRSHRDAALAGLGVIPTLPNALAAAECLTAIMRAGGLSDRVIGLGIDQLGLLVSATAFEDGILEQRGLSEDEVLRYYADVQAFYERLPPQRYPALASIATAMTQPGGEERLEFGLRVLIAGFEALSEVRG